MLTKIKTLLMICKQVKIY